MNYAMHINLFQGFILGCCIGSFINVIIYRLPLNQSIFLTRSRCRNCSYKLKWFDNIPIFSWLFLLGKCRNCKANISINYPIIEIMTGLLFLANFNSKPSIYINTQFVFQLFLGFILITICVILSIFDLKFFWLPSSITLSGLFIGITSSLIITIIHDSQWMIFLSSILAAILGYFIFYLLGFIGKTIFRKPVLGEGDIKFIAMLGSYLGVNGMFLTIWLSFNMAGIFVLIGLIFKIIKSNQKIPFGVFLALSGLAVWYLGNEFFLKLNFFRAFNYL